MCNRRLHINEEAGMEHIRHRVGIDAPIAEVYEALATADGVATWWTRDVSGESTVGGELTFRFGGPDRQIVMEVVELTSPTRVVWRGGSGGPAEWLGTTITFDLRDEGGETVLMFTHAGWSEPVEFMHHCSTKWASYLLSLKRGFDGGKAAPWPDDDNVSNWD
jgi:uncharacterized protein YndB with AHSA1/START domain